MTRTAIRHTLSTIVAITLVFAFASSPASAENANKVKDNADYVAETQLPSKETPKGLATKKHGQKTPEGLATKQKRPVACDCTNCSAQHCQPSTVLEDVQIEHEVDN